MKCKLSIAGFCLLAIIISVVIWNTRQSKPRASDVDRIAKEILKENYPDLLENSWRTINASGGVSSGTGLGRLRPSTEYFLLKEGSKESLHSFSARLEQGHSRTDFLFAPLGWTRAIMPHPNSPEIAPWWMPDTNSDSMLGCSSSSKGHIVHIYGFEKGTKERMRSSIYTSSGTNKSSGDPARSAVQKVNLTPALNQFVLCMGSR
jgi:hypothetical protein